MNALSELAEQAVVPAAVGLMLLAGYHNWRAWQRSTASRRVVQPVASLAVDAPAAAPRISALVAAWNEGDFIERHIRSFEDLTYPNRQLVLCAGGKDETLAIARRHASERIVVIEQKPGEGKQRALARAFAVADGDVIFLTDSDCLFDDAALAALIAPIASGQAAATTGYAEPLSDDRGNPFVRYQWLTFAATRPQANVRRDGVLGRNCAVRRDIVERLRPFDLPAPTGTDYVLSMALTCAGVEIIGVPASTVPTIYPKTPSAYLRMWRRWIKNVLIHAPRYGARRELAANIGTVALAWFTLVGPLAAPLVGRVAIVAPLVALAVASMNRVRRLAVGGRLTGTRPSWRLVAATPLMALLDQAAAVLAAYDAVAPSRRTKWR